MAKVTYKDSGVDLEVYEQSMARLPKLLRRTHSPRVLGAEGGFAGLFQLDFADKLFARNYEQPVLVSCTDGVGTKLKVAQKIGRHDSVGIDLVAMCVNDAICCGAEPLFFLDYVAMSHDDPQLLEQIVTGISDGCLLGDSALVAGETAIMPDLYKRGDYDLAGFSVGVVDKAKLIDGTTVSPGDVVLGVASSGVHSNGYSLVRKIVYELAGLKNEDIVQECGGRTVGDLLIEPTTIYVKPVLAVLAEYLPRVAVHGIAHITGGGLHENLSRILPAGVACEINRESWPVLPVFNWLQKLGEVEETEMDKVFNMGIGLVMLVSKDAVAGIQAILTENGLASYPIGEVLVGERSVSWSS